MRFFDDNFDYSRKFDSFVFPKSMPKFWRIPHSLKLPEMKVFASVTFRGTFRNNWHCPLPVELPSICIFLKVVLSQDE